MREHQNNHFAGIDIGTSTVRCVVGMMEQQNEGNQTASIIGYGSAPNSGMRKGVVVHIDEVGAAITQAVGEAERVAGLRINQATVNINGTHIKGMNSRGVIAISSANREITYEDRLRVEEAATIVQLPPNRDIIQVFAKNYRVDGQENIKDPVGMNGVRLEVDTHIVTAATPNLKSLDAALEKTGITASHHIVSSLAASETVLNRQQKDSGTVLLDIGVGTTNLVVVEDGEVQHVAVLPIGGMHMTNDLAIGLKTDLDVAEDIKISHGSLLANNKRTANIAMTVNGHDQFFPISDIQMILEARCEELLEYADKELKHIHRSRKLPGGVVLVGGGAKLPGLAEFTKDTLQLSARLGKIRGVGGFIDAVQDSASIVAVGLMQLDMLLVQQRSSGITGAGNGNNVFGAITGLINKVRRHN